MSAAAAGQAGPISIVITYPFPLGTKAAGGSRTTPEVARHLARLGADVTILSVSTNALERRFPRRPLPGEELGPELDAQLGQDGVRLVRVPQHPIHFQFDPRSVRRTMRRLLGERPVDWVLAHYNEAGCLPDLLRAHGTRLAFLATWQTYAVLGRSYHGLQGRLKKWAEERYTIRPHREAELVFAISRFTRGELVDILGVDPSRIVIAPLGVDPKFRRVPRPRPDALRRFLFFGRLVPSKGLFDAIAAMAELARRGHRGWTLRMVGDGRHDLVRRAAREHGIEERVELAGALDDAGLLRELEWAHLALLPSHAESFGLAIAEAQAAGLPVVAYAAGSVPEVVADGESGWLAPLHDTDRLADLLEAAVRDPEQAWRTGLAARERAARLFDWSRTADIILSELAERRRRGAA